MICVLFSVQVRVEGRCGSDYKMITAQAGV